MNSNDEAFEGEIAQLRDSKEMSKFKIYYQISAATLQLAIGYICLDVIVAVTLHYVNAFYDTPIPGNGLGLAHTLSVTVLFPMAIGINQSLNVHASQAIGSNNTPLALKYLAIASYTHLLYFVPLCGVIYCLKTPFKLLIEQDADETAERAWEYLIYLLIAHILSIQFECYKAFLVAHKLFTPFLYIHVGSTVLLVLWCYIMVELLGWGLAGAGIAIVITELINVTILYTYSKLAANHIFEGFTLKISWAENKRLIINFWMDSVPMVIHIYADFLAFSFLVFMALGLGTTSLNSQIAFANTSSIYFKIPLALSIVLMSYIGQEMGSIRVAMAQEFAKAGIIIFLCIEIVIVSGIWIFQSVWAGFYSAGKTDVQDLLLTTLPYFLMGCIILDGIQGSFTGILKGINKAQFVTDTTLIVYYLIGIPAISFLTFSWGLNWGIRGIWLGFGAANAVLAFSFILMVALVNWEKEALHIHSTMAKHNGDRDEIDFKEEEKQPMITDNEKQEPKQLPEESTQR